MNVDWPKLLQPPTEKVGLKTLSQFEERIGFTLPPDYREFLATWNGGKVIIENSVYVAELSCEVSIEYLLPFSKSSPSLGVLEARDLQEANRWGPRHLLRIGDDLGTGFFFLALAGEQSGSIYFAFKDDIPFLEGDWFSQKLLLPACFGRVALDFNSLGQLILSYRDR